MATFAVYIDATDFILNSQANVEINSLIGGCGTLHTSYASGVTSIQVDNALPNPAAWPTSNTTAWILDGYNAERVTITNSSGSGPYTLTLAAPGTTVAHGAGVNVAVGGTQGSLADAIVRASRRADTICRQGPDGVQERTLYAVSRTETYEAPYGRASFNVDNALCIYPYHFPVQSLTSVNIQIGASAAYALSTSYAVFPNGARSIEIPYSQTAGQLYTNTLYVNNPFNRSRESYISLTYTAGPISAGLTLAAVPDDIRLAMFNLVAETLAVRQNPQGFSEVHRGDVGFSARMRGDVTNRSILLFNAEAMLEPYIRRT